MPCIISLDLNEALHYSSYLNEALHYSTYLNEALHYSPYLNEALHYSPYLNEALLPRELESAHCEADPIGLPITSMLREKIGN